MKRKHILAIVFYSVALMIVSSWLFLCSYEEFFKLGSKGINPMNVSVLPKLMQPFYKGFPNIGTILCYILLTLAAFLTIKEKKKLLLFINITSFAMIVWLLFLLS